MIVQETWEEFVTWWRDPVMVSWKQDDDGWLDENLGLELVWEKILHPGSYKSGDVCKGCNQVH